MKAARVFSRLLFPLATLLAPAAQAAPDQAFNEAVIDATPAEAFKAMTTREGMEAWMVAKADVDFRLGGLIRTHYSKDGVIGDAGTIENQVLSYDAPRMYSMRIAKPPARFPFPNAWKSVWSVVYFDAVGDKRTRVSIRMQGFGQDEESQKMREFFLAGNQYTLEALAKRFALPVKAP